ncbi:hypothetical protein TMatcc_006449 [Talaromyces marneffei ATCC 18224]|nr:uncharacterized protein EYB26_002613 [Talaromyces marneffei]KAE8554057.1 hypothetical protein EYB25_002595 [Talaromyces marneffei]QGA14957.1 hypothetical protein EYB26_002613 [Talaromyces marneffei]
MAASNDSQIVIKLLDAPSHALLRKFGSLGYSLLLRLQSELTAIESHSGDALLAGIDLHNVGATTVALGAEASTESRLREEELQNKLIKYYTLLNLFSKIQSSRIPHEAVLEGFIRFVKDDLQKDVAHTTWVDEADLMGPFTNRLPQQILITMNIVSIFRKMKRFKWFAAIIHRFPKCIRRHLEHPGYPDRFVLSTGGITNWFSVLVVILVPTIIVGAMLALYATHSTRERMAALWGFAVVFAFMTRLLATPNTDFIFATNAAFCAVLVVFVGNALPG